MIRCRIFEEAMDRAASLGRPLYLLFIATRPCFVKLGPLINALRCEKVPHVIVDSGQHFESYLRSPIDEFGYSEQIGATMEMRGSLLYRTSQLAEQIEALANRMSVRNTPVIPIVSGDTLTAGLVPLFWYYKTSRRAVHIEAGLRTLRPLVNWSDLHGSRITAQRDARWERADDEPFPEAMDSRVASQASGLLFAPIDLNARNLRREGHSKEEIRITSSLSADAVNLSTEAYIQTLPERGLIRVDLHRRENMRLDRLLAVIATLRDLCRRGAAAMLVRTNAIKAAISKFQLQDELDQAESSGLIIEDPLGSYSMFLDRLKSGYYSMLWTDSGGLQEESSVLGVRCATCRFGTDRPETVWAGTNLLVPPLSAEFCISTMNWLFSAQVKEVWPGLGKNCPYSIGASARIVNYLDSYVPAPSLMRGFEM